MLEEDDLDGNYVNNLISDLESNSFYVPRKLERIRLRKTYKTVQRSQRRRAATRVASDPEKLRKERQRDENSRHSLIGAYRIFRQNCLRRIREGAIGWEPTLRRTSGLGCGWTLLQEWIPEPGNTSRLGF